VDLCFTQQASAAQVHCSPSRQATRLLAAHCERVEGWTNRQAWYVRRRSRVRHRSLVLYKIKLLLWSFFLFLTAFVILLPLLEIKQSSVLLRYHARVFISFLTSHFPCDLLITQLRHSYHIRHCAFRLFRVAEPLKCLLGSASTRVCLPTLLFTKAYQESILTVATVNPFSKKEAHSSKEVITYKVLTILSWLLSVVVSVYYCANSPARHAFTVPGQNLLHPSGFTLNFELVYLYL